ncbi:MAG TPA: hypothetical protein VH722_04530, partial [Alphaproteobacteria bacterium]|nr:hypothetical protein [Alphaproteobacteria bacterium]
APAWADKLPLPKAAYSADVVFFAKGRQTTGHLNVDGPKERRQAKNAAGVDKTLIIRRDKGKAGLVYDLKPSRKLAVALRMAAAEAAGEIGAPGIDIDAFYGSDAMSQGSETIEGLQTTKYAIKIDGGPDLVVNATVWATDDGIIVKMIGKTSIDTDAAPSRMELKNIQRGPQDPSLFEVPAGLEVLTAGGEEDAEGNPNAAPAAEAPAGAAPAAQAPANPAPAPAATPPASK